ncbi:GGDEF domain-containing protein [Rhodoferax sp.]|uniref:GGDEF domain-containing protein n=1 Tax=Rhodoferax sp. TaxID=50421 RepID=UPI002611A34A|nr:GGDEF domain-containing protein [Rhodoferax sp.]MDD2809370.1 GGDEF domain-containing protein [Rhodoferax sp.]
MDAFQWDECFVTGVPKVDEQHHELVNMMNRFGDVLTQPGGTSPEEVDRVFGELADYARFHFSKEEDLMITSGLDIRHVKYHREAHAKFLEDVTQMHATTDRANHESASTLLTFLTNWLAYHILGTDHHMARLLKASKAGESQHKAYLAEQNSRDPATATLLRSMTVLFNQVTDRNRALLELNQTLEARIEARTSELVNMNHQLENMAMTDVLTGLPNRRHAMLCLDNYWQQSIKYGTPLACMVIDADGFKVINDSFGHEAGDGVLRELARCLRHAVRNDDVVCRLGGDEFLILCDQTSMAGVRTSAEKLRRDVSELCVSAGSGFWMGSVSVGVAERAPSMTVFDELLKLADDAVYVAKRQGRNRVATVQGD